VRAGGIPEFVRDGANALMVAPHDTAAIGEGLARLLEDAALRDRLRAGGLETAGSRPWGAIYEGLLEKYRAAMGTARASRAA
jgi:glycosyltransferase involved in cell wall biosynthesis